MSWCWLPLLLFSPRLLLLLFSLCSVPSTVSCLFSPFLSSIPPSVASYLPPPPSRSLSFRPVCLPLALSVGLMWDWLSLRTQPSSKTECGWMRASHWGSNLALVNERPPSFPTSYSSSSPTPPPTVPASLPEASSFWVFFFCFSPPLYIRSLDITSLPWPLSIDSSLI